MYTIGGMNKEYLGIIGLLVVTMLWGGGFIASDIALLSLTPIQIITGRFLLATLVLLLLSLKKLKNISKAELKAGIILGICLFSAFLLQTIGLKYTTPSKNAFLTAINVVFVPLIVFIALRKKPKPQVLAGVILAIIGAGILSLGKDLSISIGDFLSLLCAVGFALQIFFTGLYVEKYNALTLNLVQMSTAFLLSFAGMLVFGELPTTAIEPTAVWTIIYLGIASTTITYFLQTVSQKYVKQTQTAIILSLEAVFATIFSILILGEQITLRTGIGSFLILSAVVIAEFKFKKRKKSSI